MGDFLKFVMSATFALSFPLQVWAEGRVSEKVHRQYMVEAILNRYLDDLSKVHTGADAIKILVPKLPVADQAYARDQFKKVAQFPKVTRLNRGLAYDYSGKHFTLVIDDIYSNKYRINGKADFTYSRDNSLKVQTETLARKLSNETAYFHFFIPQANAQIDWAMIGIGVLIGSIAMPLIETIRNEYIRPWWDKFHCEGKDPNDFVYQKSCGEYFAFQAKQRPSIPNAKPTATGKPVLPYTAKAPKCYTKESPTFEQEFENTEQTQVIRRTINYKDSKATEMVEEMVKPANSKKLIYKLNESGQLIELYEGDNLVLTRDPKKKEMMTSEKFKEMEVFDKAIETVLASLKLCDEALQTKLQQAADQDGSLVAKHVLTSESGSVAAPGKESPPATK